MNHAHVDNTVPIPEKAAASRGPSAAQIATVVAILAVGVVVTAMTSEVTEMAEPGIRVVDGRPFLAEQAGEWKGGPLEGMSEGERAILPPDTLLSRRIYKDAEGHEVYCSIVLEGRDATSIHRPELCLTGQGWELERPRLEHVATPAAKDGAVPVSRLNAVRTVRLPDGRTARARSIFLYWFVGKDRVTASHPQRIFLTTVDRVFRNRNERWAYFLIHVPIAEEGSTTSSRAEQQALQLVTKFVQDLYPMLVEN